jgi:hypothetical protein
MGANKEIIILNKNTTVEHVCSNNDPRTAQAEAIKPY